MREHYGVKAPSLSVPSSLRCRAAPLILTSCLISPESGTVERAPWSPTQVARYSGACSSNVQHEAYAAYVQIAREARAQQSQPESSWAARKQPGRPWSSQGVQEVAREAREQSGKPGSSSQEIEGVVREQSGRPGSHGGQISARRPGNTQGCQEAAGWQPESSQE